AQGKLAEAIKEFEKALIRDPFLASTYLFLGDAYYEQGNIPDAIQKYKKARTTARPYHLGIAYLKQKQFDLAEINFLTIWEYEKVRLSLKLHSGMHYIKLLPQAQSNVKIDKNTLRPVLD